MIEISIYVVPDDYDKLDEFLETQLKEFTEAKLGGTVFGIGSNPV